MDVARTIDDARRLVRSARARRTIGLVPTMGALHDGHFRLIDAARARCGFVVVSIFVNPTQFGPGEDLASYPRPVEADLAGCEVRGVDAVFLPGAEEMYPEPPLTSAAVEALSGTLCGRSRPGHFAGVCLVVAKLLNIVQPDVALFGEKDYQQLTIIRRMVRDLNFPVEIAACPTVREADGLARSSRNRYLTPDERRQAPALHGALKLAAEAIARSAPPAEEVIAAMREHLAVGAPDGRIDYVQIVDPDSLADVSATDRPVRILLAVRIGKARLIDNIQVDGSPRCA